MALLSEKIKMEETKKEGLLEEWLISIPGEEIDKQFQSELNKERENFEFGGYRKGKVPIDIIRKNIGTGILSKIIEREVDSVLKSIFEEKGIRPALQPMVEIKKFDAKGDLSFTVKLEKMPKVPSVDWNAIELETFKVKITDEDLTKAHEDIVKNFKNFIKADDDYVAKKGDAVIIDFLGTINGEPFDGNKATDIRVEIGANQFIPGFEDQLIGTKTGMSIKIRAVFPKDYNNKSVAGKPVVFDVKIKQTLKPESVDAINDDFAKKLGLENIAKLNEMIQQKIEADITGLARLRMKKILFDKIDENHKFDIPQGMLNIDFETMWKEIEGQIKSNPDMFKGKNRDDLKKEYGEIAKRRVRLGILLAEIARENSIEVNESDITNAAYAEAMMRPGQEKIVLDFYAKPENAEKLKGPILEEKAVDYILTKIKKVEIEMTSKEFFDKYAKELQPNATTAA
jgi:trigger factor